MAEERPAIPRALKRDVLIESGYRCAIPHCRETTLEIHHIVDWAEVRKHTFDNLIALCANCHARVTRKEIDPKAIRQIKGNLSVLTHRYGDLERRILVFFAQHPSESSIQIDQSLTILTSYLLDDGLVRLGPPDTVIKMDGYSAGGQPIILTAAGREFVTRWLAAASLE